MQTFAQIPMRNVGPIKITGALSEEISVPLATLETPLWFSVSRGARISRLSGGIGITVTDSRMTRSIILEAPDGTEALRCAGEIKDSAEEIQKIVSESSRFARLKDINYRLAANLIYLRLEFFTGDASGHNMVTNAAGNTTTYDYDSTTGRKISERNALGKYSRFAYNSYGQITKVWGESEYPLEFAYDLMGRKVAQTTYRDATVSFAGTTFPTVAGDVTTWTYDESSGLVISQKDLIIAA